MVDESALAKQFRKIQMIRETNAGIVREIEELGGAVDLVTARIEHLVEFLVGQGIMDRAQQADEQMGWELGLKSQLVPVRDALMQQRKNEGFQVGKPVSAKDRRRVRGGAVILGE